MADLANLLALYDVSEPTADLLTIRLNGNATLLGAIADSDFQEILQAIDPQDRHRLTRVRQDLRADTPTLPRSEVDVPPSLILSFPPLIADPLRDLVLADRPERAASCAIRFLDAALRFLGSVCMMEYFADRDWHDERINSWIETHLERPSLGQWLSLINSAIASSVRSRRGLFLLELPDCWRRLHERQVGCVAAEYDEGGIVRNTNKNLGTLDFLLSTRNAYAHSRRDSQEAELACLFRDHALAFALELDWLAGYELWLSNRHETRRCSGLTWLLDPSGPRTDGMADRLFLRRLEPPPQDLDLWPFIVSERSVVVEGDPSSISCFSSFGQRDAVEYTAARPGRSISTLTSRDAFRRHIARKRFPILNRDGLSRDELWRRIDFRSQTSLQWLSETSNYRSHLHHKRSVCEGLLQPWIRSTKPLLGITAKAGAGKSGVMASLYEEWTSGGSTPVLFLLARLLLAPVNRVTSAAAAIRHTLFLHDDVSLDDVVDVLGGDLVVVIDGLNEHAFGLELLDSITDVAVSTLRDGRGPRFAVSWRDDQWSWKQAREKRRALWWTDGGSPSATDLSDNDPYYRIPELSMDEVGAIWELYREKDSRHARPQFHLQEFIQRAPWLLSDFRNPLKMKIALRSFHEQGLRDIDPDSLHGGSSLYARYLRRLDRDRPGICDLLRVIGQLILDTRSSLVRESDIANRARDLVYSAGPESCLDFLIRNSDLAVHMLGIDRLVSFTVERISEEVVGDAIAADAAALDPRAFSRYVVELENSSLTISSGACRCALERLEERFGLQYLLAFIDASPSAVTGLAGRAVYNSVLGAKIGVAKEVGAQLATTRAPNCLMVAEATIHYLRNEGRSDLALELAHGFTSGTGELAAATPAGKSVLGAADPGGTLSHPHPADGLVRPPAPGATRWGSG